jgi:hypothetical protein
MFELIRFRCLSAAVALATVACPLRADDAYLPGGPLAGVKLPLAGTQHGEALLK